MQFTALALLMLIAISNEFTTATRVRQQLMRLIKMRIAVSRRRRNLQSLNAAEYSVVVTKNIDKARQFSRIITTNC